MLKQGRRRKINKIIINGRACSGKDVIADYLVENYGFVKISFASGIYKIAREYFHMQTKDRALLQSIGQKMREIDPDIWIKAAFKESEKFNRVVISDLRQENEYIYGARYGFKPIRVSSDITTRIARCVDRDGIQPRLDEWENSSENGADNFEYIEFDNNGGLYELHQKIDDFMSK